MLKNSNKRLKGGKNLGWRLEGKIKAKTKPKKKYTKKDEVENSKKNTKEISFKKIRTANLLKKH